MPCPGYYQTHDFNSQKPIIPRSASQRCQKEPARMPLSPPQAKAEDLLRVTKPSLWLAAVTGLYLNIMRPRCISCTTASMGMLLDWMMSLW